MNSTTPSSARARDWDFDRDCDSFAIARSRCDQDLSVVRARSAFAREMKSIIRFANGCMDCFEIANGCDSARSFIRVRPRRRTHERKNPLTSSVISLLNARVLRRDANDLEVVLVGRSDRFLPLDSTRLDSIDFTRVVVVVHRGGRTSSHSLNDSVVHVLPSRMSSITSTTSSIEAP